MSFKGSELPDVESCRKNYLPLDYLKSVPKPTKPPFTWWRSVRKSVPPRRGAEVPPQGTVVTDRRVVTTLVTSLPEDAREFS